MRVLTVTFISIVAMYCADIFAHPNHPLDDKSIYLVFEQANSIGIESGGICVNRSVSQSLREMCSRMLDERQYIEKELRTLVVDLGIVSGDEVQAGMAAQSEVLKRLSAVGNKEFDDALLKYESAYLKRVIRALEGGMLDSIESEGFLVFMKRAIQKYKSHYKEVQGKGGTG
jgi:predicted outer membrane protein